MDRSSPEGSFFLYFSTSNSFPIVHRLPHWCRTHIFVDGTIAWHGTAPSSTNRTYLRRTSSKASCLPVVMAWQWYWFVVCFVRRNYTWVGGTWEQHAARGRLREDTKHKRQHTKAVEVLLFFFVFLLAGSIVLFVWLLLRCFVASTLSIHTHIVGARFASRLVSVWSVSVGPGDSRGAGRQANKQHGQPVQNCLDFISASIYEWEENDCQLDVNDTLINSIYAGFISLVCSVDDNFQCSKKYRTHSTRYVLRRKSNFCSPAYNDIKRSGLNGCFILWFLIWSWFLIYSVTHHR